MDIKHFVENRIFSRNYFLAKAGYLGWYYIKTMGKNPLLIYQMGKVGSRSVEASLRGHPIDIPVIHLHYLSEQSVGIAERYYYEDLRGFNRRLKSSLPHDLFASYFIRSSIYKNQRNPKKWKIITLVRDPIARNISGFFQGIPIGIPDFYQRIDSITCEELLEAFLESDEHRIPLNWFDLELKPFFGIDVYADPFDSNKGYQIYSGEIADLLLLRVEDLSRNFSGAVSEFLGIEGVTLLSENTANEKQYYNIYKMFVNNVALPASYLERMYNSKFAQNFYTEQEIQTFISKWQA